MPRLLAPEIIEAERPKRTAAGGDGRAYWDGGI